MLAVQLTVKSLFATMHMLLESEAEKVQRKVSGMGASDGTALLLPKSIWTCMSNLKYLKRYF